MCFGILGDDLISFHLTRIDLIGVHAIGVHPIFTLVHLIDVPRADVRPGAVPPSRIGVHVFETRAGSPEDSGRGPCADREPRHTEPE